MAKNECNIELLRAAEANNLPQLKQAIENGAKINDVKNIDDRTATHIAAMHNSFECLEFLINNSTDIHEKDIYGYNAISLATSCWSSECIELLIHSGANAINIYDVPNYRDIERLIKKVNIKIEARNEDIRQDTLKKTLLYKRKEEKLHLNNVGRVRSAFTSTVKLKRRPSLKKTSGKKYGCK